ncbi:MAG: hypothetical protein ACI4XG_15555, partial [Bradyrhizobium sp.]
MAMKSRMSLPLMLRAAAARQHCRIRHRSFGELSTLGASGGNPPNGGSGSQATARGGFAGWAERSVPIHPVIARLDRAIQYAAAYQLKRKRLWNTGSPAFAGDDT